MFCLERGESMGTYSACFLFLFWFSRYNGGISRENDRIGHSLGKRKRIPYGHPFSHLYIQYSTFFHSCPAKKVSHPDSACTRKLTVVMWGVPAFYQPLQLPPIPIRQHPQIRCHGFVLSFRFPYSFHHPSLGHRP